MYDFRYAWLRQCVDELPPARYIKKGRQILGIPIALLPPTGRFAYHTYNVMDAPG